MHFHRILPLVSLVLLASCNSQDPQPAPDATISKRPDARTGNTSDPDDPSCFRYTGNGDTVTLHLERAGGVLSGPLEYRLREKDRNRGTLTISSEDGPYLRGWYRFQSEGMESVREEVFRRAGNALLPAYGPVEQSGDTARFEKGARLQFDSSRILSPVPCASM